MVIMNPFSLSEKTILITGASSGIGKQTALTLSGLGAKLFITGKNEARLKECFSQLDENQHRHFCADLTDLKQLSGLTEQLPPLNGLVYCAGIWKSTPIKFLQTETTLELFQLNFIAAQALVSNLLRQKKILPGASIVFVTSIAAQFPYKGSAAYAASKAALESFSKTLSLEVAHQKIRSNCIAPAMVQTPMYEQTKEKLSGNLMHHHTNQYPLGTGKPENIANAIAFLLSDASEWMTGTTLQMDGGLNVGS